MTQAPRKPQVAARFGAAAHRYEDHAPIQRITAERLADRLRHRPADPGAGPPAGAGRLDGHRHLACDARHLAARPGAAGHGKV
ncbi:hypothetical protein G6F46_015008 [Rhizopus delemar]|nr:hypothetical protein G6F35_014759 [Rhizopus arrhizus]KAG1584178.1 hypothetical protein G6F46_015008 [Rhizopus delemar]